MSQYAWKIQCPGRADLEGIGTLEELVALLTEAELPGGVAPSEIVRRTRIMQHEGQGVWKSRAHPQDQWTLHWIELGWSTSQSIDC